MAKKKTALTKRFVHGAVVVSTLMMALLCALGMLYLKRRPQIIAERAQSAMEEGRYAEAAAFYEKLDKTEEIDAKILSARYGAAQQMLAEGKFEEAETAFSALGDYSDARSRILECRYGIAKAALDAGQYEEAAESFYSLAGFSDALAQYNRARYEIAAHTEASDPEKSFSLFYELGGYSDAFEQASRIAMKLTGMNEPQDAVNRMLGVSEEEIVLRNQLVDIRNTLPKGVLAVGFYHTVGLRKDGTVIACGSNSDGQCSVAQWTGIQAVDCGAYHTVGLRADGTVIATGRNVSGQCNVNDWTDIIAIACTDYDTVGLKKDGTIVTTGYHDFSSLQGWSEIVSVGGGSYAVVAVMESGQMLSSHPSSRSESTRGAVAADVSTGYAVILMEDGTVTVTAEVLDSGKGSFDILQLEWREIVSISASSTGIMGIDKDGAVHTHWFRNRDEISFADLTDALAIAAGGTHSVVLNKDGSVVTRGSNSFGECDTGDWNLGEWQ